MASRFPPLVVHTLYNPLHYGLNMSPQNLYVEVLTPKLEMGPLGVIKIQLGHKDGALVMGLVAL